jgi:glycosyltransferase involved in cell wall biosynthesis
MNIYFLSYVYEVGVSAEIGGFRKLWELAARLQEQGHQVRFFFPKLSKHDLLKPIPCTSYPLLNISLLRPVSAYLSMFFWALVQGFREKPDIIYFRTSPNVFSIILGKCLGAKVVLEVNANFREFHKTINISFFRHFIFSATEYFNAKYSDKIIALTPGLKEMLIRQYKISPKKIDVVPSGTDIKHFFPQDSMEPKKKIGLNPSRPVIGFAGIFYPHQGVDTIIHAAKYVLKSYPDALFLIVGSGMMEKPWKDLAKSEGAESCFIFTGQIPYENMPTYFNSMDIFVAPFASNRGETSPLKVLDALACGKVVIASDIPSLHLLADEFNGSIVAIPPDDPVELARTIIELLSNEARRNRLAKNGRRIILEKYSWEIIAEHVARGFTTMS